MQEQLLNHNSSIEIPKLLKSNINNESNINKYDNYKIDNYTIEFTKNTEDKGVQTDFSPLYDEEDETNNSINNSKNSRKDSPDLIRDKIFNYFNKNIYIWLTTNIINNKPRVIPFTFKKNNKKIISDSMQKYLKDLFFDPEEIKTFDFSDNEFLKKIFGLKYEEVYQKFISDSKNSENDENTKYYQNFSYLSGFLKEMEEKEEPEYISRVSQVAIRYHEWITQKIHLFKKQKK
jgi:hypothetical protein